MTLRVPHYDSDEFARRGDDIYDRIVKPKLRPEDKNKFVAIDIDSSDYEIDSDDYRASEQLLARHPNAQIWIARAGQRAAYRIGPGTLGTRVGGVE